MDVSQTQEFSQRQQLSSQMLHSLTILRMNALELREYINTIALENPVVEVLEVPQRSDAHVPDRWRVRLSSEQPEVADRRSSQTLTEDLKFQLLGLHLSPRLREAVEYLIRCLDASGYLPASLHELVDGNHQESLLEEALEILQRMEPRGVGARSLSECLLLQLRDMEGSELAAAIAREYLPELARHKGARLVEILHCTPEALQYAVSLIRRCEPKPANGYSTGETTEFVVPDLYIFENEEHQLQIVPDETACPYIQINPVYQAMSGQNIDPEATRYLQERIDQASAAISYIAKRNLTLMQCAQVLVQEQELFFRKGPGLLRPLSLHTVAERMRVSESTVSRAINGKYFRCAWGMYPLKHLVQRSVAGKDNGQGINAQTVCAAITALIAAEDKKAPLSDLSICRLLARQGIQISRRTVAKYREQCHFGPASDRKME